jgi:hypothetical protein
MKTRTTVAVLLALAATCPAQDRMPTSQKVIVYLTDSALIPTSVLPRAENTAGSIMATANVQLEFRTGQPKADVPFTYAVKIATGTSEYLKPGALAYAQPYGSHIVVFYDRIRVIHRTDTSTILGHVLAHEITHMLRGDTAHASAGLMKATWTSDDYFTMFRRNLPLSPDDIEEINTGIALTQAKALLATSGKR